MLSRRQFLTLVPFLASLPQWSPVLSPGGPASRSYGRQVLNRPQDATSVIAATFENAIVLKNGDLFLITDANGTMPIKEKHGFGLYYQDCRVLNGFEMRLSGHSPLLIAASAPSGTMARLTFTNPETQGPDGRLIPSETLAIQLHRLIDDDPPSIHELLRFQNLGKRPVEFSVSLSFLPSFEDVLAVRGFPQHLGNLLAPMWDGGLLHVLYEGKDSLFRGLTIIFDPVPNSTDGTNASFDMELAPRATRELRVSQFVNFSPHRQKAATTVSKPDDFSRMASGLTRTSETWMASITRVESDSFALDKVLTRALHDLRLLQTRIDDLTFYAAGTPWFVTLFGRDSVIAALQTLAFDPSVAEQTLRLLAKYQGRRYDAWRDEEPGRILHELRTGELARLGLVPYSPYYGTVDATPLFLILLGRHAAWTGSLSLFEELRGAVERAVEWIEMSQDRHGHGYLAYESRSPLPLGNQGWKDSGNAIVNADGSLVAPPIALSEVQGYVYQAKRQIAGLYDRVGETVRAGQLRRKADELRARFNRDFWLADKGFYALALQVDGTSSSVISSNPGQALWGGIVSADKAGQTVERLMARDMFSGWGVRTLSDRERSYDPLGYHVGTVWPHDNSLIAAGCRRYGFDQAASRILSGLFDAAMHFNSNRLPELFAGISRENYEGPVSYPAANPPQAWAAGAIPYLLETMLGLVPQGLDHRLRIVQPLLPPFLNELEVHKLRIGGAEADLRFIRASEDTVRVEIMKVEGRLDILVEERR
ncbi:putative Amylo-alpha-1,6-glucosidase [Nitrospira sp. KM1]|uniref:amylo-alpha-1,6-glucosidase n=1 Tax=Nitrospira sp. KM1 TaxID=1936990 RepID=UPI0013A73398|nr:amylo-alpha-1,6-glucosidase [Nitrospira sp. KM1]BCA56946.1 putative Amylo-alpha-1,6-glucosidase [Nitrospira sp. KM1]